MAQQGYYLELIEQKNHTKNVLSSLDITSHYDIFKMLPLNEYDSDFIENIKYDIDNDKSKEPYKMKDNYRKKRDCYYLGNYCFEFCNVNYLTRFQIEHTLLQQPNVKLIHTNATNTSKPENEFNEISIYSKWFIPKQLKISFS